MGRFHDLTGHKYGRLLVIEKNETNYIYTTKDGKVKQQARWDCQCDCGNQFTARASHLKSGNTRSCGCIFKEQPNATKHGFRSNGEFDLTYNAWGNLMKQQNHCPEWNDFSKFLRSVGVKPSAEHYLSRKDFREQHGPTNTYWRNIDEDRAQRELTYADLGDEFFCDFGTLSRTTAPTQERERATA